MMNVLALGLLLTSLLTAGFFPPEKQKPRDDFIVKEGHRVIMIEFEKDDGSTKVLIWPQDSQTSHKVDGNGFASNVYDKMYERMEGVKEGIKEASSSLLPDTDKIEIQEGGIHHSFRPRELVCDAYGKCKHKIAAAIGRTSQAVTEKAHEAAEKVSGVEEAATEAAGKIKDTVSHTAQKASDKVQEAKENVKDSANEISSKTMDRLSEKASEINEEASRRMERAKEMMSEKAHEEASRRMEGAKETASEKAKEAEEWSKNASDRAKKGAQRVKKEGKKELSEIIHHAGDVAVDVFDYVVAAERVAQVTGVLHLMGFAAAYGMSVWVTFASSQVLAGALPRQQFAVVQSRIYPVYFNAMAYSVGMALLGHLMSPRNSGVGVFQGFNLTASLGMVLVNLLCLEPRATQVMLERMKEEKEEGKGKEGNDTEQSVRVPSSIAETAGRGSVPQEAAAAKSRIIRLSETLQRLNSCSSFLNVMTLVSLTWHLVCLGPLLHPVC